jgi:hypothetical protein
MTPLQIAIRKVQNDNIPYYPTVSTVRSINSQIDHFPYTKFYEGDWRSNSVRFFDREAGYRKLDNACYRSSCQSIPDVRPDLCFEGPASVTYPCHRENLERNKCRFVTR